MDVNLNMMVDMQKDNVGCKKKVGWTNYVAGLGTAFFSVLNAPFFSVLLKNAPFFSVLLKNATFFCVLFLSFGDL